MYFTLSASVNSYAEKICTFPKFASLSTKRKTETFSEYY